MGQVWWCFVLLNAFAITTIYAAPRELSTEELITEPRPGEEYVNIQTTSKDKVDLLDKSFTTSHRVPELSKTNRSSDFQTAHKIPSNIHRSVRSTIKDIKYESSNDGESYEASSGPGGTTIEPPLERVVTRTSIKMSKSKKVQKSILKLAHDGPLDIKSEEGFIDERSHVDEEEREIMKKKMLKNEKVESVVEEFSPPTRFNVPFEDEAKEVRYDNTHVIVPNPVIATTHEPPITTFNYKNIYDKTKVVKNSVGGIPDKLQEKYKYETIISESIKTAESKSITSKKETRQEKKDKHRKDEINQKEESGFYLLPVNKQSAKVKEDNFDFVDVDEKVLVPAGSSPSQSSRINIKKGPNGQDYEYEYVYYYYDDDDEGGNGGGAGKEGKVVSSTTEKIYNGHDGPSKVDQEQNSVQGTSTSGPKYLPTEATKPALKGRKKTQTEVVEEAELEAPQHSVSKNSRGGGNGGSRYSNRQAEPATNEVVPSSGRSQFRSRGRSSNPAPVQTEEIPPIGEERLPANTRFPPRSRANNAPVTSPQPQETTARTRSRENGGQSRLRLPNLGLLDSSSFRTHASDASVEEDAGHDELARKAAARGQSTETSYRRGRPTTTTTTTTTTEIVDVPAVTRRPTIRKPVEDRRPKIPLEQEDEEEKVEERRPQVPVEDSEKTLRVPLEEPERKFKVPLEEPERPKVPVEEQPQEEEVRRPQVPLEQEEQSQKEKAAERSQQNENERQIQTTRESDAEEGVFDNERVQSSSSQSTNDLGTNSEGRLIDSTTEDQSAVGLTSAMMEKVALDLYAILQQAQNENIRTNFIDGNSTDVTTPESGDGSVEYSTFGDAATAEPSSTTVTTTTTTTTPEPTTTTTTTTTPAPTQAAGRGRYRGRAPNGGKGRNKQTTTTTTTELPEEVSSPRTRGRYHGGRGSGASFGRSSNRQQAPKETNQEETHTNEETPRPAPERAFGERPRSRFRASPKVTTNAPSTAPPAPTSGSAPAAGGSRNADRFHSRRRGGGRGGLPTTQHSAEGAAEEEKHETHHETEVSPEEATPSAPSSRPNRPRIGGAVRPLRPGPRAPLLLPKRGQNAVATASSPAPPLEHEDVEKEQTEAEGHAAQANDEAQEAPTTPVGDALSRLKSRPRLRIGANPNQQRPQTPAPPPANRRKLVSSLLPKRKPEEKQAEKVEEVEEKLPEEIPVEEEPEAAPVETPTSTPEPDTKGLSGLLAGRRRNLNRRPGTIYTRSAPVEA